MSHPGLLRTCQLTSRLSGKKSSTTYRLFKVQSLTSQSSVTNSRVRCCQKQTWLMKQYLRPILLKPMHWSTSPLRHHDRVLGKLGFNFQKQLRSNVSKLSETAKRNATKNQDWLRKLRVTPVMTALKTAMQRLVALATRLKKCNSGNKVCTINKLSSQSPPMYTPCWRTAIKVWSSLTHPKKNRNILERDLGEGSQIVSGRNDKAMCIAEINADHQASMIQQQPVTLSAKDLRLRVI